MDNFPTNIFVLGKSQESLRASAVKAASKRIVNGAPGVEGKGGGPKSISVMGDSLQQLSHEGAMLADFSDEKATEKVRSSVNPDYLLLFQSRERIWILSKFQQVPHHGNNISQK